jgi:hypothetical protein
MFRLVNSFLSNTRRMKQVLVYKGLGMYEKDTAIIERVMNEHVNCDLYKVDTVTPTEIIKGNFFKVAVQLPTRISTECVGLFKECQKFYFIYMWIFIRYYIRKKRVINIFH